MATHISYLLKTSKKVRDHNLDGLFCGGAKLDKNIQKKFEKKNLLLKLHVTMV